MNLLERLQKMAECVPPGGSITLARDWLVEELARQAIRTDPGDLGVPELCRLLGRRPSTVRAMCARGDLVAYRYRGAEWRASPAAVTEYLANARTRPAEALTDAQGTGEALGAWRHARRTA